MPLKDFLERILPPLPAPLGHAPLGSFHDLEGGSHLVTLYGIYVSSYCILCSQFNLGKTLPLSLIYLLRLVKARS